MKLAMINHSKIHSSAATRVREAGEIIPVKAEQSATYNNDEVNHGAGRAIDMNLNTLSHAIAGTDGSIWFKVTLDKVYCVQKVIRYKADGTPRYFWTCTKKGCSNCLGNYCDYFILTVSTEGTTPDMSSGSECKFGDIVMLQNIFQDLVRIQEFGIIGMSG